MKRRGILAGFAALAALRPGRASAQSSQVGAGLEAVPATPAGTTSPAEQGQGSGQDFAAVRPPARLAFPRDHGAHPEFRTEWWYATGWARTEGGDAADGDIGFQITFFRSRTEHDRRNPSRFAPTQLVLAHAAIALPSHARLLHDQRAARAGFALASVDQADTRVAIGDWSFERDGDGRYQARIRCREFHLGVSLVPRGAPLLQGDAGYSRKGPGIEQASFYYSRPQMQVSGTLVLEPGRDTPRPGARIPRRVGDSPTMNLASGVAWLDHEWSSALLDRDAQGWDWAGINMEDGSALMAFRIRRRDGGVLWSTSSAQGPVAFAPLRHWTSPRTGIRYPVAMRLSAGDRTFELQPLFDDQELDARASTGTIYWEGAVRALVDGRPVGRGYLELTGYGDPMRI